MPKSVEKVKFQACSFFRNSQLSYNLRSSQ